MSNWFKKQKVEDDDLPAELKGKTPEEVVRYIKVAEELGEEVKKLRGERETEKTQVATLSSQFDQVKAKLAATEANLNRVQNPPRQEDPIDWNIDPEGAFKQNIQPLVNVTMNNAAMSARLLAQQSLDSEDSVSPQDAKTMNGRLFRVWESEINEEAKKYPASSMGTPQTWVGLFYLVKGRHADELANPETRKKKYNFVESGSAPPPAAPKPKDGVESLTDQEKHVADRMGVSHENYAKRKKGMTIVNA